LQARSSGVPGNSFSRALAPRAASTSPVDRAAAGRTPLGTASILLGVFVVLWIGTGGLRIVAHGLSADSGVRQHATLLGTLDAATQVSLFLLALGVTRLVPLHRLSRTAQVGVALAAGAGLIIVVGFAQSVARTRVLRGEWLGLADVPAAVFPLLPFITWNLPLVIAHLGLGYAIWYAIHDRRLQSRLMAMEMQLSRARFDAFVGSMHPDLLFSIIQAIRLRLWSDPDDARSLLVRASDVLRSASRISLGMPWRLRHEMDLVELSAQVERIRTGLDVEISRSVPAQLGELLVPFGTVHLLVREILVGGDATGSRMRAHVDVTQVEQRLILRVETDRGSAAQNDTTLPLPPFRRLEDALQRRFGSSMGLKADRSGGGRTTVVLTLPLHGSGNVEWPGETR
jgi:hypothetical protein